MTCSNVQENIAWGRVLSTEDQNHVMTCSKCNKVALQFEEIDSAVKNNEVNVPEGFADRVMKQILIQEEKYNPSPSAIEVLMAIFHNQAFRWGVGGTSFLLAFAAN